MKIMRECNGLKVEIELTEAEMLQAYEEVSNNYDCEFVNEYLMNEGYYDIPENILRGLAKEMREYATNIAETMGSDDFRAMDEVLGKHKNILSEYMEER